MTQPVMNYQPGEVIDVEITRTWRWPTAVTRVPRDVLAEFAPVEKPQMGDVALCRVSSVGATTFIENADGCNMSVFPGTLILGTFAPRYAPDEFEGRIPEALESGQEICLLNRGGTIGNVASKNSNIGEPTKVSVLGFLHDRSGRRVNTLDYGKKTSPYPCVDRVNDRNLVLVVGTSMNSGKSSTAKAIVYSLAATGHRVVAGKATGQAARRDVLLMKAAGAVEVVDFVDFGYPSTYQLSEEEVSGVFWQIYNELYEKAGPGGYIVIEIADGIYQRETAKILRDAQIKRRINHLIFSCCDSLSAVAGVQTLANDFGLHTTAISGPAANSVLGLNEMGNFLENMPAFNNMVMDVDLISDLITTKNAFGGAMLHSSPMGAISQSQVSIDRTASVVVTSETIIPPTQNKPPEYLS